MESILDRYVEVAFPRQFDQTFTYLWPKSEVAINPLGYRVLVPFQKRLRTGYILQKSQEVPPHHEVKNVQDVLDPQPVLTSELIGLIQSLCSKYGVTLGEALQTIVPPGLIKESKKRILVLEKEGEPETIQERELLEELKGKKQIFQTWKKKNPERLAVLKRLEKNGWLEISYYLDRQRASLKKKQESEKYEIETPLQLNDQQASFVQEVTHAIHQKKCEQFLLHGVTGSGKTEVYLHLAQKTLDEGRNVIALVPEISLTPQFVSRFRQRFGAKIALFHSQRSESERVREWMRILQGEAKVVVGTRSAVFSPLDNIGLMIIDEEHDRSYKQGERVQYHARDLAILRAKYHQAVLILGSATPSIETFQNSKRGHIHKRVLSRRIHSQTMPHVEIVDLKKVPEFGKDTVLSPHLKEAIQTTLENNKQVILFLNRRGYSPQIFCPGCGSTLSCPACSITLTFHQKADRLLCHYCDFSVPFAPNCSKCNLNQWLCFGFGTEKVETEIQFLFPDAKVARLDRDSTSRKGAYDRIYHQFFHRKIDILIGTQMLTKGLDFENVDLVGVLLADQSLQFPDFRSAEHTFCLLTQVIGRSGRGARQGRAILQTYQPEHYSITSAAKQNFEEFFDQEIELRKQTHYPPFSQLVLWEMKGKDLNQLQQMSGWLKRQMEGKTGWTILGPSEAPISKIKATHRMHLLVKAPLEDSLESIKWIYQKARIEFSKRLMHLKCDIDPYDFM